MKNYNYQKIKSQSYKIVKKACYSPKNKFKESAWACHILSVIKHSLKLGKKFKADLEVLELAALFHDYAGIVNYDLQKEHHIESAKMAEKILSKLKLPLDKIEHIKECIISHRGSVKLNKKSIEAKILASADAMSHITELADMFFLTFNIHGFKVCEGAKWLKAKLIRSWNKIMPQGKKLVREDYKIAMKILDKAIK